MCRRRNDTSVTLVDVLAFAGFRNRPVNDFPRWHPAKLLAGQRCPQAFHRDRHRNSSRKPGRGASKQAHASSGNKCEQDPVLLECDVQRLRRGGSGMRLRTRRKRYTYAGGVAVITGGSRGLGLIMARELRK